MAGPDLNYAYVTVLNSVPGRGGHFGSLRTRAALNSLRGRERGERLLLTWRYSIRRPFVTGLENPRSSIVTCFLGRVRFRAIMKFRKGWGEICGLEDCIYMFGLYFLERRLRGGDRKGFFDQ